jgi:2-amino-4-hydroxy-6-hydroxymethyldihydropteridine diphosphokinase
MPDTFIGLGSNVGDRLDHLETAARSLDGVGTVVAGSPIYETDPVGGPEQGRYLNAVMKVETNLSAQELLGALVGIERAAGRTRGERWGPRTLDLDILAYGDETIIEPGLTIPHAEIRNRRFVLMPLADVSPGLEDVNGPYADSLGSVADQPIRRVNGPYEVTHQRWMDSIESATDLTGEGERFHVGTSEDWANPTGDMFGAFLSTVVLRSVEAVAPDQLPSSLTYRFVHGVPLGAEIEVKPIRVRGTSRSADYVVSLSVDGRIMGRSSVATIAEPRTLISAPPMPDVLPFSACIPVDELFAPMGRLMGASVRSWRPLERWDVPDLVNGRTDLLRAWSPNVTLGTESAYLRAAGILMPIDALIWPSAMYRLGLLGTDEIIVTPTLDFSGRFPDLSIDPGWHLAEVAVDHMTDKSIAGTIRVWARNGAYLSVGTSHNLVIGGDSLLRRDRGTSTEGW